MAVQVKKKSSKGKASAKDERKTTASTTVRDHDSDQDRSGFEASSETFRKRDRARHSQEPQPLAQNPRAYHESESADDYDTQDHSARSTVRKKHVRDPLQTPAGTREYKRRLARDEGEQQEAPVPRGLPLRGPEARSDERRRGIMRDSDIGQASDDELNDAGEGVVLVELCPPLRTYNRVGDPTVYKQEDAPFRVSESKARELFALRNDRRQPIFRNYRQRVVTRSRTASGTVVEEVADEVPVIYRHIMRRQRPNNQAPEDETVLTQRGVVSKGRDDVDYGGLEDEDASGELRSGTATEGSRRRVSTVPEKARSNSGDLQSGELRKGGGVRV